MKSPLKFLMLLTLPVVFAVFFAGTTKAEDSSSTPPTDIVTDTSTLPSLADNLGDQSTTTPTTTPDITPTSTQSSTESVTLTVRDDSGAIAFFSSVDLPTTTAPDLLITATNSSSTVAVSARSVLAILESAEASTTAFQITDLSYFSSFNSFLINCIAIPASRSTPLCFNWTDAVNSSFPQVGVDQQLLNNGDSIVLFFGPPHKTIIDRASVTAGQQFTATALNYNLATGNYDPLTGVTLGVGIPNADFTFTELATSTVDSAGQAAFAVTATGTLAVGIQEDFYFPAASIIVTGAVTSTPVSLGGGGGSPALTHQTLNIPSALAFISKSQNPDGSFDSPLTTDWTALAFSAADSGPAKLKLKNYLLTAKPAPASITDYERHAMALEALGINPYNDTGTDYITPITNAFDGQQIGTPEDNDDIFALIALKHAGYTSADNLIQKEINYVLGAQNKNGSWDNIPDLTAAAILALQPLNNLTGVNNAITSAVRYLKSSQQSDGGWGNVDSTSWVQTAINSLAESSTPDLGSESFWTSDNGYFPTDFLANSQGSNGGVQSANPTWSTGYAVVGASGKSWLTILDSFPKPLAAAGTINNAIQPPGASSTTPTSTLSSLADMPSTSTPATTTLPTLVNLENNSGTPSSTLPSTITLNVPEHKSNKPKTSASHINVTPAVLGTSTIQTSNPPPASTAPSSSASVHLGFLANFWNSVVSFFRHLW